ncbi:MAG: DEAD/DEAH box helicase [Verrucomicrobiota bacterium]
MSFEFHPAIQRWFEQTFGSATEPQARGWPEIQAGRHVLISAPTGSGKTLAAFLASLDRLFREGLAAALPNETQIVYVSPLKALSNDIRKNLQEPLAGIRAALRESGGRDIDVRAEVRTGDTSPAQRLALSKRPPHILVTTPESLYLLLTSESGRRMLRAAQTVILDEIHAVVDDRRGAHLALSLERLAALTGRPLQRIGLSATQKPVEEVARFLVGAGEVDQHGHPNCAIIDVGHVRQLDVAIEIPKSPLEAVMSNEIWTEVYHRLTELIREHRTTLVFVNTRRLAERVTLHLSELLGADVVASHHGSLSPRTCLEAEGRLKRGELKALVATASLELGIDIGSVDLVCQLAATRSMATFLQRVGRAEHRRGGLPKGRIFPLSRDELVECAALLRAIGRGELDRLIIPEKPLDVLAQQMVAAASAEDWDEEKLFALVRNAWPYRGLSQTEFSNVINMLAEGFSTKRGRRGALIHHDAVNHRLRGRRGARLTALVNGGAIPDNSDYRVVLEPSETFIGTVNEDFAVESMAGEIFQLGNASWRILRIESGRVRVEDAQGQPPGIPFWIGEAPARTNELSRAVSRLRTDIEHLLEANRDVRAWLIEELKLPPPAAAQVADYYLDAYRALGALPSQKTLVMERFFDESGGMQLVIHSPYGNRINRAWGLALRKRFCRSFNFELQAAATDDAIIISLGTQHSFPLDDVFRFLHPDTVRRVLVQALLDAPMFAIRWRWNASRALAVPRQRGGRRVPAPWQRMESENLLAAVFPDQLACLENIIGDREVPDHPLVNQTIADCLTEAMDIDGLEEILRKIGKGEIRCLARDLPEPSPMASEILHARPYAFLDNAPLEERRTQAVLTRRSSDRSDADGLGLLDAAAIERVQAEAWPAAGNADELHDAFLVAGLMSEAEAQRTTGTAKDPGQGNAVDCLRELAGASRVTSLQLAATRFWLAAERRPLLQAIYPPASFGTPAPAASVPRKAWERPDAIRELLRGRLEISGPVTATQLAGLLELPAAEIDAALLALEAEGFVLRGRFHPGAAEQEWCDRRLLARIHRLTVNRLRAEIQPVSLQDFQRFLLAWQRLSAGRRAEGPEGLEAVLQMLDGRELPLAAWETTVLSARVADYDPHWLDRLCFSGRIGWGRLTAPQNPGARAFAPLRSSPISLYLRENLEAWLELAGRPAATDLPPDTRTVLETLQRCGALFFVELIRRTGLLPVRIEQALSELAALGFVTCDGFDGLRALLVPTDQRPTLGRNEGLRRRKTNLASVEFAGRWSPLQPAGADGAAAQTADVQETRRNAALEKFASVLLHRYGIVFRRLLERESLPATWYELGKIYRRREARGEIRGGYFVGGVSGEQFALPEAIGLLRSTRKREPANELIVLSGADPLNLLGVVTPGPRITALASNRILFQDGTPIAALEGGEIERLAENSVPDSAVETSLRTGKLPPSLRPYYK